MSWKNVLVMFRNWYHGLLERFALVAHVETNDPVVRSLGKYVAADQQEPIVVPEVFIKFCGTSGVRVVGEIEVVGIIYNVRVWIWVHGCEVDSPIISIPGCLTPILMVAKVSCATYSNKTRITQCSTDLASFPASPSSTCTIY